MGRGVGSMKQEFGYDLNTAKFTYDSLADTTGNSPQISKEIFGVLFHFTTTATKTVTITLSITIDRVSYTIQQYVKKLPNHLNWQWKPDMELPQNVSISIDVSKTATACSMNMITVDR